MCCTDIEREGLNTNCAWQESRLSVLWTIGVFALNFGPVIVGPVLDYVGPKITAMLGELHYNPTHFDQLYSVAALQMRVLILKAPS